MYPVWQVKVPVGVVPALFGEGVLLPPLELNRDASFSGNCCLMGMFCTFGWLVALIRFKGRLDFIVPVILTRLNQIIRTA